MSIFQTAIYCNFYIGFRYAVRAYIDIANAGVMQQANTHEYEHLQRLFWKTNQHSPHWNGRVGLSRMLKLYKQAWCKRSIHDNGDIWRKNLRKNEKMIMELCVRYMSADLNAQNRINAIKLVLETFEALGCSVREELLAKVIQRSDLSSKEQLARIIKALNEFAEEPGNAEQRDCEEQEQQESCLPTYLEVDATDSHTNTLPSYDRANFEPVADRAAGVIERTLHMEESVLRELGSTIHQNPELAFREHYAANTLTHFMQGRGWRVERGICGMETAWKATFSRGIGGRTVGFNAEMDGMHVDTADLIAEGALAAALGVAAAMAEMDVSGRVLLLGTPAEERGGGKIRMLRHGAYKSADAMLMIHPGGGAPYKTDLISPMLAIDSFSAEYLGKAAHAALAPHEGINALDAAILAYTNINALRQQTKPYERVHGVIDTAGYSPNVIPAYSCLRYGVRSATLAELVELKRRVVACLRAAADATGCQFVLHDTTPPHPELRHNGLLAVEYAAALMRRFGTHVQLALDVPGGASTDFGAVTYAMPGLHPAYEIYSQKGVSNHTAEFARCTDTPIAHRKTLEAATGVALTAFRVLCDDDFASAVQSEFHGE
ncbi:hypothetical protein E3P77_00846 [Wallemia ichthyophaga]|nr:hypothetical protein E3P77_00846 [Wallemia ichthyophaga]